MAQSIFSGATDYSEQTCQDILSDVLRWVDLTRNVKKESTEEVDQLETDGEWNQVLWDIRDLFVSSIHYYDTVLYDLELVTNAIKKDQISDREINLLHMIGAKSAEYNKTYGTIWHSTASNRWQAQVYDEPWFSEIEKLYSNERDYFVTLQNAMNAAARLKGYMRSGNNINVSIGGNVDNSQIQAGSNNSIMGVLSSNEIKDIMTRINQCVEKIETTDEENGSRLSGEMKELCYAINEKNDRSAIQKSLDVLKNIAVNMTGNVMAAEIIDLLGNIKF